MEFKTLRNIETSTRQVKLIFLALTILNFVSITMTSYFAYSFAEKQRQKIYVLAGGHSLQAALAEDKLQSLPVQTKLAVTYFHERFFTLDPDAKVIECNTSKALHMGDESVIKLHLNYKEKGYYTQIIAASMSQRVEVDSIQIDLTVVPIRAKFWGKQRIIRSSSVTTRELITECNLREVSQSDNNPVGYLIENLRIISNKDLRMEVRR